MIGSVTDGYLPQEEQVGNTRKLLKQLKGSNADILICTKSDLVVRDIDLLKDLGRVTVSWSINTLDEDFKDDMDSAVSIERRLKAMKQVYDAGIRTVCFVASVFPGITDFEAIFKQVKNQCDLFWLENLNLRGGFKKTIMDYITEKYPNLVRFIMKSIISTIAAISKLWKKEMRKWQSNMIVPLLIMKCLMAGYHKDIQSL